MLSYIKRFPIQWLILALIVVPIYSLFVQPPSKRQKYPDLTLATANRLGVPYQGVAWNAGKAASLPSFALSLNAEFGTLPNQATFDALMRAYSGWSETKPRVTWKPDRSYTLLDFLPPLLQACSGLHFQSSRTPQRALPSFTEQQVNVLLTSNCWGFAWEVLFQADNRDTQALTISTADPTSAWRAFTSPGFDLIQSSRTQPRILQDMVIRNQKIQAGDVLLIWHENPSTTSGTDLYLDHVAIVLDKDVYYEKSGSGDKVPFRVSTWDMITRNFPVPIFFWEWRRLVRNNPRSPSLYGSPQTKLRAANELFGLPAQLVATNAKNEALRTRLTSILRRVRPSVAQTVTLQTDTDDAGEIASQTYTGIVVLEDLVFNKETGRASLPPSAFQPEWYTMVLRMLSPDNE
eukprot:scaffold202_cov180-Amphora_coffeaeformis.AAC.6